mgnify:CR=1 FL=1
MARIMQYEYPEHSLLDVLKLGKVLNDHFDGSVDRTVLSRHINMSPFGGAFASKLTSAKIWGITLGRGTIELTRDAKRLMNLYDLDFHEDLGFYDNVPLFNEISLKSGKNYHTKNSLSVILELITNADPMEIKRKIGTILKVYNSTFQHRSINELPRPKKLRQTLASEDVVDNANVDINNIINVSFPGVDLSLPANEENLMAVISLLTVYKNSISRSEFK